LFPISFIQFSAVWKLKGKELKSGDGIKVQNESYNTKLGVKVASRGDSGTYTITATNVNGTDIADVEVIVLDRPEPPTGLKVNSSPFLFFFLHNLSNPKISKNIYKVSDVHADGCTLNWSPPADGKAF